MGSNIGKSNIDIAISEKLYPSEKGTHLNHDFYVNVENNVVHGPPSQYLYINQMMFFYYFNVLSYFKFLTYKNIFENENKL